MNKSNDLPLYVITNHKLTLINIVTHISLSKSIDVIPIVGFWKKILIVGISTGINRGGASPKKKNTREITKIFLNFK